MCVPLLLYTQMHEIVSSPMSERETISPGDLDDEQQQQQTCTRVKKNDIKIDSRKCILYVPYE